MNDKRYETYGMGENRSYRGTVKISESNLQEKNHSEMSQWIILKW